MTPTLPDWIAEHGARERARANAVARTRLRAEIHAFGRWWLTFGRALVHFLAPWAAAIPMAAMAWALWGAS